MVKSKLLIRLIDKYFLLDNQKIFKWELEYISKQEKIDFNDLVYILGAYRKIKYKDEYRWTKLKLRGRMFSDRDIVKFIKLDLKYIKGYGSRYYTKDEIISICKEYNVRFDIFLMYINRYRICFNSNYEVLENNKKGLWLGQRLKVSKSFVSKHYFELQNELENIASMLVNRYNCYFLKDKIIDRGKDYILTLGDIERNYKYDVGVAKSKMLYKTKYIMLDSIIQEFKYFYDDNVFLNFKDTQNLERQFFYNDCIDEWLFDVEFTLIEKIIIDQIKLSINYIVENRINTLEKIRIKLDINKNIFYENIINIQEKLILNKKVRLTESGDVMVINE